MSIKAQPKKTGELLSVAVTATRLGLSRRAIYRMIKEEPDCPAIKLGKRYFFREEDLDKWLKSRSERLTYQ